MSGKGQLERAQGMLKEYFEKARSLIEERSNLRQRKQS